MCYNVTPTDIARLKTRAKAQAKLVLEREPVPKVSKQRRRWFGRKVSHEDA